MDVEQIRVIRHLDPFGADWVYGAEVKAEELAMAKGDFLRVCRQLRDQGYAYLTSIFDEDCRPCGSAYMRTSKGDQLVLSLGLGWKGAA